jgi:NADPH:quinone reductase-like Zn-dependent oxidoreductase
MRAAGIETFGGPVRSITVPDPRSLAPDEVLIGVMAAGVGNWDEFVRVGDWEIGRRPPMALGVEAAGVVTKVGGRNNRWAPGDAVMTHAVPVREQGAWSAQLIVDGDLLAPKPKDVPWEEAAAFPVPALTAAQSLLEVITPDADGLILVNGAGGVTGGLTAALAWLWGAHVIATAGPASAERLHRLGVEAVYDYRDRDWPQAVRALTNGIGVPAAVNAARGGEPATLSAVAEGGRFATITGAPPKPERGVSIANVYVRPDGRQLRELAGLLAKRELEVSIDSIHPLAQAADALALVTRRGASGAVVLRL